MATPAILQKQPFDQNPGARSPRMKPGLQVLLFLLTLLTTTMVGMRYMDNFRRGRFPLTSDADILPLRWAAANASHWAWGLPFSLTLVGILLAHELAHYAACRAYGVQASLPYLIPAPSLSGTLGALIRLRSRIPSRAALMAIGASGPVAGFAVAVLTTVVGLKLSARAATVPVKLVDLREPLLMAGLRHGLGMGPVGTLLWHPVLLASWIGLLVTSLNLLPAGQLDGGHVLYALSPNVHRRTTWVVIAGLVALGVFFWMGWLVWAAVLLLPAMRHPRVVDEAPLQAGMVWLAPVCLGIFLLAVTVAPFEKADLLHGVGWLGR